MAQAHDDGLAVWGGGAGGDFEFGGQAVFGDDEGVVTGAGHGGGEAVEMVLPSWSTCAVLPCMS